MLIYKHSREHLHKWFNKTMDEAFGFVVGFLTAIVVGLIGSLIAGWFIF